MAIDQASKAGNGGHMGDLEAWLLTTGGVKEPCTDNSHTNPIMDLTYLPVMYLDTLAIA